MTTRRYKKVSQVDSNSIEEESKKQTAEKIEFISIKIHALFWVIAAVVLGIYLDIFHLLFNNHKINRVFLNIAVACFSANICIIFYLTFWLPIIKKITIPWSVYCPRMIPTATFLGFTCLVCLVIAFWPLWGFFSPLFIAIFFLGLIFSTHFIPYPC